MAHVSAGAHAVVAVAAVPISFQVGAHVVQVAKVREGRWTVRIDETAVPCSYATQAEAWEAGVREADRIDRVTATP